MMLSEHIAKVNGIRIFYRIVGEGSPVVLLHGFAQTGHMWEPLLTKLAKKHTVIIPDLRGAGASEKSITGYDKKTMAKDIHELVKLLGFKKVMVVGHDIGLMVAYAYAAQFPDEIDKVILMDAFLPGIGNWKDVWLLRDLWHFHFYGKVPLALVKGRERIYLEHFWNDFAANPKKLVPEKDRKIYAKAYAQKNAMRSGFEYFKSFEQDAKDFSLFSQSKLSMPFLVLTGEKASGNFLIEHSKIVAYHVLVQVIPGAVHWLLYESTKTVIPPIIKFLN